MEDCNIHVPACNQQDPADLRFQHLIVVSIPKALTSVVERPDELLLLPFLKPYISFRSMLVLLVFASYMSPGTDSQASLRPGLRFMMLNVCLS